MLLVSKPYSHLSLAVRQNLSIFPLLCKSLHKKGRCEPLCYRHLWQSLAGQGV